MNKSDIVKLILQKEYLKPPQHQQRHAFAPTNIALVKYWGKRNTELNLPITSSLSISLDKKGASTCLTLNNKNHDTIVLNNQSIDLTTVFAIRLITFLDLFRIPNTICFDITLDVNIPIAAGLASSACGFAALVKALNKLYGWNLPLNQLSILSRLGSGSASRSLWDGFVEWQRGTKDDGMDSYAASLKVEWPDFTIGLLIMQKHEKSISSREAMQRTVSTSALFSSWPEKVHQDITDIKNAIQIHDFDRVGQIAESNAMTMHALMWSAWPPICYSLPETIEAMQKVWILRKQGLKLYFTQDAGPNLKLLFLKKDIDEIKSHFRDIEIIQPFK